VTRAQAGPGGAEQLQAAGVGRRCRDMGETRGFGPETLDQPASDQHRCETAGLGAAIADRSARSHRRRMFFSRRMTDRASFPPLLDDERKKYGAASVSRADERSSGLKLIASIGLVVVKYRNQ